MDEGRGTISSRSLLGCEDRTSFFYFNNTINYCLRYIYDKVLISYPSNSVSNAMLEEGIESTDTLPTEGRFTLTPLGTPESLCILHRLTFSCHGCHIAFFIVCTSHIRVCVVYVCTYLFLILSFAFSLTHSF